jgi:hypothetical protein
MQPSYRARVGSRYGAHGQIVKGRFRVPWKIGSAHTNLSSISYIYKCYYNLRQKCPFCIKLLIPRGGVSKNPADFVWKTEQLFTQITKYTCSTRLHGNIVGMKLVPDRTRVLIPCGWRRVQIILPACTMAGRRFARGCRTEAFCRRQKIRLGLCMHAKNGAKHSIGVTVHLCILCVRCTMQSYSRSCCRAPVSACFVPVY